MASRRAIINIYRLFTMPGANLPVTRSDGGESKVMMVAIAAAMFIVLFGWGADYFGWDDAGSKIQLALFTSFVLGILCGFKSRG